MRHVKYLEHKVSYQIIKCGNQIKKFTWITKYKLYYFETYTVYNNWKSNEVWMNQFL